MKSRKGIALPIEMIVIIAIAVLVLVVLAALFIGGTRPLSTVELDRAFANLCGSQLSNCAASPGQFQVSGVYDINGDGVPDQTTNLLTDVCGRKGLVTEEACKRACGCP